MEGHLSSALDFQEGCHDQSLDLAAASRLLSPLFSAPAGSAAVAHAMGGRPSPWRRDEHARFMQALEVFGAAGDAAWPQIASFVGSRSPGEARLHAQQYLQQLMQQYSARGDCGGSPVLDWFGGDGDSQNDPGNAPQSAASSLGVFMSAATAQLQQRRNGRRPKVWTFQEDKAFETALASWGGGKPYSWAKIAAALPGKSAKDVRNRYEKLLGDVSTIEGGLATPAADLSAMTLNRRPPPVDTSTSSRPACGMLSPTLFELLDTSPLATDKAKEEPAKMWNEFLADDFKFAETREGEAPEPVSGVKSEP